VYFRAANEGACTYMDDRRDARLPHGACWYDLCDDLEVIEIPGDHFSILRQVWPASLPTWAPALLEAQPKLCMGFLTCISHLLWLC
jgi:hypothetical protein